jgi:hypothetical protein
MDNSINSRDVIGREPLGQFLAHLGLKPWQAGLLSLAFFLAYQFILPAYFGVLFPREGLERSSIVDRVNQIGFLLIHPAVMYFFVWQTRAIAGLYRLVLPLSPASMRDGFLRAARMAHSTSRHWLLGILAGGIVAGLGVVYGREYFGIRWYSINLLMAILLQFSRFLLFYLVVNILVRHLIAAFNLNRIYRHIKLPVLIGSSKYEASFDAITRYGLSFAGIGGVLGIFIAMRFIVSGPAFPEDAIYLAAYMILIPLAFSLPFWQAHNNMRTARLDALNRISDSLQEEYDRLMGSAIKEGGKASSERLVTLRAMLEMTEKAPTWPFENWTLYRVLGATLSPFIMTGLGLLIDVIV